MRDWTVLLNPEEIAPSNFNALVEDIINQEKIKRVRQDLETLVTKLNTLTAESQTKVLSDANSSADTEVAKSIVVESIIVEGVKV